MHGRWITLKRGLNAAKPNKGLPELSKNTT